MAAVLHRTVTAFLIHLAQCACIDWPNFCIDSFPSTSENVTPGLEKRTNWQVCLCRWFSEVPCHPFIFVRLIDTS